MLGAALEARPSQPSCGLGAREQWRALIQRVQAKGLAEIRRVLKPGGRLLVADMKRPSGSPLKRLVTSVVLHHGHAMHFGIEDLPPLFQEAGFEQIELLDDHILRIGFVRAKVSGE
jgi:SAM-dependent methyltransferase